MKKRNSIFKQLVFTLLTPVIVIITGIGIYNFKSEEIRIVENRERHISQLKIEIREFIDFFDQTILEFEQDMSVIAKKHSDTLVNHIFENTALIEIANLDSLKKNLRMSPTVDIYIIDTNGVIVNTTYKRDLGLDFYGISESFRTQFTKVWDSGEFMEDRISMEMSTKLPKKYTYHSTKDKLYIVELGLYDLHSKNLVKLFTEKLDSIPVKYDDIDTLSLYFGKDNFANYQGHEMFDDELFQAISVRDSGNVRTIEKEINGVVYSTMFILLDINDGYVVRVKYNNQKEVENIKRALVQYGWLIFMFVIPIFLIIFWRARIISKPISVLLQKVDEIHKGNLNIKVPLIGNNEVTELSDHFNQMVDELKESRETLEEKVKERTLELEHKNKLIESTHNEIQDSINYAERLQKAILPSLEEIQKHLPSILIYFQPKDVVSGDFFWFEHYDGYEFIAAADCTGHGVPGAMVSVVCNNALKRSLFEFSKISPENVLNNAREIIIDTFSNSDQDVKDGMDISLCRIDKKNMTLKFSGANNPLWIVRSESKLTPEQRSHRSTIIIDDLALIEFKGDKQPVGLHVSMTPFNCQDIDLMEGDMLYLFTDGYADQFGGIKGKKFMYKPFKRMLIANSKLPADKQKSELHNTLIEWKGTNAQVDDICVLGVRV